MWKLRMENPWQKEEEPSNLRKELEELAKQKFEEQSKKYPRKGEGKDNVKW